MARTGTIVLVTAPSPKQAAITIVFLVAACNKAPGALDAGAARAAYEQRASAFSAFERATVTEVSALDLSFETEEAQSAAVIALARRKPQLKAIVEGAARDASAHGAAVKLIDPRTPDFTFIAERSGSCGLWRGDTAPGNVDPDDPAALQIDGRRVGWGKYQTAFVAQTKSEADAWHPVLEVKWSVPVAGRGRLDFEMCFRLDLPR